MLCSEAADLLNRLQLGRKPGGQSALGPGDQAPIDELVRRGLAQGISDGEFEPGELDAKKRELADLQSRAAASGVLTREIQARKELLRTEILELADREMRAQTSVEYAGRRFAVTYLGRNLFSTLMTRLDRVGTMELEEFESQMGALTASFDARAIRAKQILDVVKAALPGSDPSGLRSAAVGLAARTEAPGELAGCFAVATRVLLTQGVSRESALMLAEAVITAMGTRPASEIEQGARELLDLRTTINEWTEEAAGGDVLAPAAMLFSFDRTQREDLMTKATAIVARLREFGLPPESFAPWLLVAATGLGDKREAIEWIARIRAQILEHGTTPADAEMAAAVLSTSPHEQGDELVYQFETASAYLSRLSTGAMVVPAAMLAVLPTGIEESLDELRLASATVGARGLSTGGMESLSLGLKLLMQTAILATTPGGGARGLAVGPKDAAALSSFGLAGLSLVIPAALTAFAAFHQVTLQRFATSHYAYHPVHTHYYYG